MILVHSIKFENELKSGTFLTYFTFFIIKRGKTLHKQKKICCVEEDTPTTQTTMNWFRRFRDGNFDVKYALRSD